jgi:beta-1,4-mannosyl-glycoprotein beta-1,4-N-acetylglucosaminyltransferase
MKIYDCFTFYNELDLLEIRLNELNDVVDYFVLVEAEKTHQNKNKNLFYLDSCNEERFIKFKHKIIHIVVPSSEFNDNTWYNEKLQRKKILDGLVNATEEDFIIVSDLDEIPSKDSVVRTIEINKPISSFEQILHYFYMNTQLIVNGSAYNYGSVMLKKSIFESDTEIVRYPNKSSYNIITNGGWHFSFLGDETFIYNKLQNYAHHEFNYLPLEEVKNRLFSLNDILNRTNHNLLLVNDISYLPSFVLENLNKFNKYIKI